MAIDVRVLDIGEIYSITYVVYTRDIVFLYGLLYFLCGKKVDAQSVSYPQQDADGAGHAHLTHPDHCHLVPGRLSRAAGQRADELLQH